MIGLPFVYTLAGLTFLAFAMLSLRDATNPKRWGNCAFWGLLALSMLAGDRLSDFANGLLVLALVAIAGTGQLGRGSGGTALEIRAVRLGAFPAPDTRHEALLAAWPSRDGSGTGSLDRWLREHED
jgi:uncharacterized membrane protein